MSSFSEKLQKMLSINKLSQRALAEELHITTASVSRYCSGEQIPRQNILQKIAEYFSVSVSYLLDDANDAPIQAADKSAANPSAVIISLLPELKIKELESVKSYIDYLIQQKLYTEDI